VLADPVEGQDIFEEMTRMLSTDAATARPPGPRSRLRLAIVATAIILVAAASLVAARLVASRHETAPVAQPTGSSQTAPSGDLFGDMGGLSCVEQYSLQTLAGRGFAFAGTVASIGQNSSGGEVADPYVPVSFTVQQWFRGGAGTTVTVAMFAPDLVSSAGSATYSVGSRLLVSGERSGAQPRPDQLIAWACGFSRWYDDATAAEWEATLG
jgi:hypothetical protein